MIPSALKQPINLLFLSACFAAPSALALQTLEATDGATLYAKVSKKEQTRILVQQGRISSIRVKDGALGIDPDDETGQVFVTVPAGSEKPINGFLTTANGETYTLVLQPTDIPAESVVIKQAVQKTRAKPSVSSDLKNTPFEKQIKRLVRVMANDELPDDLEIKEVGDTISLWKEAAMTLERQYLGDTLAADRFIVSNVSKQPLVLAEPEFYRKGVYAVAISQLNLAPGEATRVYVIRERAVNE